MIIGTAVFAFILSASLTALFLPLAHRWAWLDRPNDRSAHLEHTPSSGGLAVVLALLSALVLYLCIAGQSRDLTILWMGGLLAALCLLGAWDDRAPLPVRFRFCVYLLIGAVAAGSYLPLQGLWGVLALLPAMLLFAWLMNLYNFMDGIDGLAALQAVLSAGVLALIGFQGGAPPAYIALAVAVAGAYGGFLLFNWPPAKLFMGDAGSLSAGFALGWLGLWGSTGGWIPATAWLVLMSPFLLDTGFTLLRRARRGVRVWEAHNEHIYQRLSRRWSSHQRVDTALLLLQLLWLVPLALAHSLVGLPAWLTLFLALAPQAFAIAKSAAFE
ncbi:MAG: Fuc2NAc and GlcNAc transferase [Halieaceae bacterium]